MTSFTGIWATFQSMDSLIASIHALQEKKIEPTAIHAPFKVPGKLAPITPTTPNLSQLALIGAVIGAVGSIILIVSMSLEWIQALSAKPIVSFITIVPVAFEVTIFCAVIFILLGLALSSAIKKNRINLPISRNYKNYSRFTRDRFGLVVACDASAIPELKDLFTDLQAEEVFIES